MGRAAQLIDQANVVDTTGDNDTLRLWESYREQALLWRGISIAQLFATLFSLILLLTIYVNQETVLNVPAKPDPGLFAVDQIPDHEFINSATEFVNLIASYQAQIARTQFKRASEMLREPMFTSFINDMMGTELKAITNTRRTQLFFLKPAWTSVDRSVKGRVTVKVAGERLKIVAGKELPMVRTRFFITMTTIPKNPLNPFGIVISNVKSENF